MIHRTAANFQQENWKKELAEAITQPLELLRLLDLENSPLQDSPLGQWDAIPDFRLLVPRAYVARMRKGDINDPLLKQVLPLALEKVTTPDAKLDPVGDTSAEIVPGLLHKYHGRALLVTTGACAIHCRYCFRRHFPYAESNPKVQGWKTALDYLRSDQDIDEVILSGGDPLTLDDQKLLTLMTGLRDIPHIKRLRIHSRLPIVLPSRITDSLIETLHTSNKQLVMVMHANHAQELDDQVYQACLKLKQQNLTLLNQAVLLKGINDDVKSQIELNKTLFESGVLPYYLHCLDPVQGAMHFDVGLDTARQLHTELSASLPGYLVPKLVQEIAGEAAKTPVN